MFNTIDASLLRKAALMVSKDVTRFNIRDVRVTAQTVEATDGHMAFRAAVNLGLDEPVFLRPKRKIPVNADVVEFNPDDVAHSRVVGTRGLSLGVLLEYFSVEDSHVFPDLDRVLPEKPDSDDVGFTLDLKLLARVSNGGAVSPVRIVPGKDSVAPVRLEGDGWEAVIMPIRP